MSYILLDTKKFNISVLESSIRVRKVLSWQMAYRQGFQILGMDENEWI